MKTVFTKKIAMALVIAMVAVLPLGVAFAEEPAETETEQAVVEEAAESKAPLVCIGSQEIFENYSAEGADYNAETNTLSLNGFTLSDYYVEQMSGDIYGIYSPKGNLKIVLSGTNTIRLSDIGENCTFVGIDSVSGLTISGNGILNISIDADLGKTNTAAGIAAGSCSVKDAKINISSAAGAGNAIGIWADEIEMDNPSITISADKKEASKGIDCTGDVSFLCGNLKITAADGIQSDSVIISGGDIEIDSDTFAFVDTDAENVTVPVFVEYKPYIIAGTKYEGFDLYEKAEVFAEKYIHIMDKKPLPKEEEKQPEPQPEPKKESQPKTGDQENIMLLVILCGISAAAVSSMFVLKRKNS